MFLRFYGYSLIEDLSHHRNLMPLAKCSRMRYGNPILPEYLYFQTYLSTKLLQAQAKAVLSVLNTEEMFGSSFLIEKHSNQALQFRIETLFPKKNFKIFDVGFIPTVFYINLILSGNHRELNIFRNIRIEI